MNGFFTSSSNFLKRKIELKREVRLPQNKNQPICIIYSYAPYNPQEILVITIIVLFYLTEKSRLFSFPLLLLPSPFMPINSVITCACAHFSVKSYL